MYFEACECDGIFGKGKYKIDAYNRLESGNYTAERDMTEGFVLNSEEKANKLAEALSWAYNWGCDDAQKR